MDGMQNPYAYFNGRWMPAAEAAVSIADTGFVFVIDGLDGTVVIAPPA